MSLMSMDLFPRNLSKVFKAQEYALLVVSAFVRMYLSAHSKKSRWKSSWVRESLMCLTTQSTSWVSRSKGERSLTESLILAMSASDLLRMVAFFIRRVLVRSPGVQTRVVASLLVFPLNVTRMLTGYVPSFLRFPGMMIALNVIIV